MKSRRIRMSSGAYERLPFNPAWKQEYFDGCLVETPREVCIHATRPVAPCAVASPAPLRPATAGDELWLQDCFRRAFAGTIEFCDHTEAQLAKSTETSLGRFFGGPLPGTFLVSRVAAGPPATAEAGEPLGAALVAIEENRWALLEMIFVTPTWQRRGLATALAAAAMNALHEHGGVRTLVSRYHIGNDASRAWHRRFGFIDEPDLPVARLRYRGASNESEKNHWKREVERLETEPVDAALPWRKWRRKAVERSSRPTSLG